MIRFIIDQFRQANGPLKQPRILIADLAEEVIDLATNYLKKPTDEAPCPSSYPCETDYPCEKPEAAAPRKSKASPAPVPSTKKSSGAHPAKPDKKVIDSPVTVAIDVDPRLRAAIAHAPNLRKQAFKVLAILWDADQKNLGSLSAKVISDNGSPLGLEIRHENVRKVIRMRLENYVNVHAQGVGNGTVYRYQMSAKGRDHFVSTYFK